MEPIAHIHTDFPTKFGVPRQSGLASALESTIIFEPEYRNPDALRGIEGFSHIWLIWQFDRAMREGWSPTVLPPKRRRICDPVSLPSQFHRTFQRPPDRRGAAHEGWTHAARVRSRSGGRHADL